MERPWYKFYPEGIPREIEIPATKSVYHFLEQTEKTDSSRLAVIDGEREMTYDELKQSADRLASALYRRGFKKGDRLALMVPNCMEYVIAFFAVQRLSGTIVQLNPMYQPYELDFILQDTEAGWFIGYVEEKKKLDKLKVAGQVNAFFIDPEAEKPFGSLLDEKDVALPDIEIDRVEDIAVLQYTGGTTGRPKGAMLTHFNIIANVTQVYTYGQNVYKEEGHRFLGLSPLFHAMGMTNMLLCMLYRGTYIALKRFEVETVINLIRKHRPTLFTGTSTVYVALLNYPDLREDDFHSFKLLVAGASPMPMEIIKKFQTLTNALLIEGYGQSEATTSIHRSPIPGKMKIGSIGLPITGTDAKIVDLASGKTEMPIGEPGELVIKGPQVMKGYWNNEEETEIALRDGWLYTGDIATQDEDGYFYIVGRKKEMIIASGYNVYPVEIEEVLYEHPHVREACVFGVPDPYRGETVKAVIVTNGPVSEEEIDEWCTERLARYKVPRLIEFREELPKTAVGKILRRQLVEEEREKAKVRT